MVCQVVYGTTASVTLLATAGAPVVSQQPAARVSQLTNLQTLPEVVAEFVPPSFEKKPEWYEKQVAAARTVQPGAGAKPATGQVVTYSISTRGVTSADLSEFAAQ